MTLHLVESK